MFATTTLITLSILIARTPPPELPDVLARAYCESGWDFTKRSKISSAKGTFQFLDGTWKNYCKGNVWSPIDQLTCYRRLIKKYPHWWKESDACVSRWLKRNKIQSNSFDVTLEVK